VDEYFLVFLVGIKKINKKCGRKFMDWEQEGLEY